MAILVRSASVSPVPQPWKGGALETVRAEGDAAVRTGLFFYEQTVEAIQEAVARFESADNAIRPEACRANAERFSPEHFRVSLKAFVDREWQKHVGLARSRDDA